VSARPLAAIGGAVVVAEAVLLLTDAGPNVGLVAALVSLVGVAVWFTTSVDRFAVRPMPLPPSPTNTSSHAALRVTSLRQALAARSFDQRQARRLRDQLVAIVDDELLSVHGIDRRSHPDAARVVLGDELQQFVDDADTAAPLTLRGVTHVVTLIERL
jgi:hypothetical protein